MGTVFPQLVRFNIAGWVERREAHDKMTRSTRRRTIGSWKRTRLLRPQKPALRWAFEPLGRSGYAAKAEHMPKNAFFNRRLQNDTRRSGVSRTPFRSTWSLLSNSGTCF